MLEADDYIFISPNYFAMPPGLFKDFMDKCSVLFTSYYTTKKPDLSDKKTAIITLGTDQEFVDACRDHIAKWFCEVLRMRVIAKQSFLSRSELKGNYNDMFENKLNQNIEEKLEKIVKAFI